MSGIYLTPSSFSGEKIRRLCYYHLIVWFRLLARATKEENLEGVKDGDGGVSQRKSGEMASFLIDSDLPPTIRDI